MAETKRESDWLKKENAKKDNGKYTINLVKFKENITNSRKVINDLYTEREMKKKKYGRSSKI